MHFIIKIMTCTRPLIAFAVTQLFGTTYLVNSFSLYTIQVPMKPLLHQYQLSLLQALVQPCQFVLCLLVSQMYILLQLLVLTVQLHVLFAGSSGSHPVATDDAGPEESG